MDGLLIDSEDIYTNITNAVLSEYNRPPLPWHIKAQLQGRPGPAVRSSPTAPPLFHFLTATCLLHPSSRPSKPSNPGRSSPSLTRNSSPNAPHSKAPNSPPRNPSLASSPSSTRSRTPAHTRPLPSPPPRTHGITPSRPLTYPSFSPTSLPLKSSRATTLGSQPGVVSRLRRFICWRWSASMWV